MEPKADSPGPSAAETRGRRRPAILFTVLAAALTMAAACARLPEVLPAPADRGVTAARCETPFAAAAWRFVHAISAEMPGGRLDQLIGVSVIDPGTGTVDAVLMTLEGLVVFSARAEDKVSVSRALPPFDRPHLADGLMADVRLLLLAPGGTLSDVGQTAEGHPVCRYAEKSGSTLDVVVENNRGWKIIRYDSRGTPIRTARGLDLPPAPPTGFRPAQKIELTAHGKPGYQLTLTLISAEPE